MLRCRRSRDPGGQHHESGEQRWRRPWKSFVDCLSLQRRPPLASWPAWQTAVLDANAAAAASALATWHWDVVACPGHRCLLLPRHLDQAEGSRAARGIMANTSSLLDSLLSEKNYNRQFRPGFGGPYPSAVSVRF
ncbi:hypothetical protein HPB52_016586 [Rhipicephalus sanguineus]|uniref:Uncharacterized protein n=1 Tax=Rhipicephalus sanguineus TaxID=34632 RepID=A0A9D4Q9Q6_RHISA|nr:hypothetical protein HPB52_016586 [Rhipicephalus sanguineus]